MTAFDLLRESAPVYYGVVACLGLLVGSFLNVVAHRLPIMMERAWREGLAELDQLDGELAAGPALDAEPAAEDADTFNLAVPRSRCPHCGHGITALENVPVISWLALRGKCSDCGARISVRYPAVELATMALSLLVAWHFGASPQAVLGIVVTWFLVAMTLIDYDTQLLPDSLTLPLMWIGLIAALFPVFADLRSSVIGAAAGYLVLWSVYQLFKLATGKEGMGFGDFKLLAAIGALLGWQVLPVVILLSSLVGAVVGMTLIAVTGRDKSIPIPFGPYLAAAGFIAMLWGQELMDGYLGMMG